ncbi:MCE family protein [Nocardioides sp.]|uniref:MCE family protein n=1 Tax=Nocardioides sp. TaxID=35761 RepID=UPI0027353AC3|nr:MCE family protein [Nocardioides sp.]MDP3892925.1 MCE family protein [Nocardioides sp.]
MNRYTEAQILRMGAITLVVMLLLMAAAFNLSKFPGLAGTTFQAEFADASGLRKGNMVQVGGIRAGRVKQLQLDGAKVMVTFEVDHGVEFGSTSRASVEVLNLLGEKYLRLTPDGPGQLGEGETIPLERTDAGYDIVGVLGQLADTTERIDIEQLQEALNTVGDTLEASGPELEASLTGISRLSQTIASRDAELQTLLEGSESVSAVLAERSQDIVALMESGDLVFQEIRNRKQAIHRLLVNARRLARELRGVARDNEDQIGSALEELDQLTSVLIRKEKELKATLHAMGPYAEILGNIIGTGPWFDAYVVNLASIPTGEFLPTREQ